MREFFLLSDRIKLVSKLWFSISIEDLVYGLGVWAIQANRKKAIHVLSTLKDRQVWLLLLSRWIMDKGMSRTISGEDCLTHQDYLSIDDTFSISFSNFLFQRCLPHLEMKIYHLVRKMSNLWALKISF